MPATAWPSFSFPPCGHEDSYSPKWEKRLPFSKFCDSLDCVREEREINVTGVEPPRQAIYPSLFLFLTVIALGLAAGRFTRRVKSKGW